MGCGLCCRRRSRRSRRSSTTVRCRAWRPGTDPLRRLLRRLIAFMIDWLVLFAVLVAPQAVIALLWPGWPLADIDNGWFAWGWVVLTVSLPSWVYFTLSDNSV